MFDIAVLAALSPRHYPTPGILSLQFVKARLLGKDRHGISCVDSDTYATRFLDSMASILV